MRKRPITENLGKLPPQAIDLEKAVLGAVMIDRNAVHLVSSMLSSEMFYSESHGHMWAAIINLYDSNQAIDMLTVTQKLRDNGALELAGGAYNVMSMSANVASSMNIETHASIIVQQYLKRELIRVGGEIVTESFDDTTDAFEMINKADNAVSKISEVSIRGGSMVHISDAVHKSLEGAYKREQLRKQGKPSGINTGLKELDRVTGGWQKSDLIIVAARPGMGKTSIMLKFALSAALSGVPVCIYSLEMSDERLADNLLLALCDVSKDDYKNGLMDKEDWDKITAANEQLKVLPIYIDPNPSVSMRYIKANSRVMARKGKCGMIMIDYLQLADVKLDERNRNREQEIAQASRQAKIIAKELDIPVILLSQMSRKVEERGSKKPVLSDLRESGAIEQDADIVGFVYRPEYYGIESDSNGNSLKGYGEFILAKHRNGSCEDIAFGYNPSMTHITDYKPFEIPF